MLKLQRNDAGIWQISGTITVWRDGRPDSHRIRQSARTTDRAVAEGVKRQIENAAAERIHTNREPAAPFEIAARAYAAAGGETRFLAPLERHFGGLPVDAIGQAELDEAAAALYPAAAPATRNRQCYTPALAVLAHAGLRPLVRRPRQGSRRTVFLTPAEADALIRAVADTRYPNPWTPALVTFLFAQGARMGETLALDGRDVNLSARYCMLRDTKNGAERMITLTGRTCAALQQVPNLGRAGPLFLRYDGRPYEARAARGGQIRAVWARACRDTGLDPARHTPHTARHSWATWFFSQTRDMVRLRQEGGWLSGEWQRYVQLSSPALGEEARRAGFVFDAPQAGQPREAANG